MAKKESKTEASAHARAKKYAQGKYVPNPYKENEVVRGMIERAENAIADNQFKG